MKEGNPINNQVEAFLQTLPADSFRWESFQAVHEPYSKADLMVEPRDNEGLLFDLYQYMFIHTDQGRLWSLDEVCEIATKDDAFCRRADFTDFEGSVRKMIDDLYDSGVIDYVDGGAIVEDHSKEDQARFRFNTDFDSKALGMWYLVELARLSGKVGDELLSDLDKAADRFQNRTWSPDDLSG